MNDNSYHTYSRLFLRGIRSGPKICTFSLTPNLSSMKIISWNCNMAFRKKRGPILAEKPDILVVAECEQPLKMSLEEWENPPNDYTWIGENSNKGLGIFTFGDYSIRKLEQYNPDYKLILPVIIQKASFELFLIGAWTKRNPIDKNRSYIAYLGHAIEEYRNSIESNQTVIIGDLNSNKIWDKKRDINHSYVVNQLLDLEI